MIHKTYLLLGTLLVDFERNDRSRLIWSYSWSSQRSVPGRSGIGRKTSVSGGDCESKADGDDAEKTRVTRRIHQCRLIAGHNVLCWRRCGGRLRRGHHTQSPWARPGRRFEKRPVPGRGRHKGRDRSRSHGRRATSAGRNPRDIHHGRAPSVTQRFRERAEAEGALRDGEHTGQYHICGTRWAVGQSEEALDSWSERCPDPQAALMLVGRTVEWPSARESFYFSLPCSCCRSRPAGPRKPRWMLHSTTATPTQTQTAPSQPGRRSTFVPSRTRLTAQV